MTTVAMSTIPSLATSALFQGWVAPIIAAMPTIGWVQSSDTGQITDPTTLVTPTSQNESMGYQIWEMADTHAALYPVKMKIEFGSGNGSNLGQFYPGIWITIGTGSDGAGNLTGQVGTRYQIDIGNIYSSTALPCYFSGTPSRLTAYLWSDTHDAYSISFAIERTKNQNAVDTTDGIMFGAILGYTSGGTNRTLCQYIPFSGPIPSVYDNYCSFVPSGSGTVGSNIAAYPIRNWKPGETNPFLSFASYINSDIAANILITMQDWANNNHTYYTTTSGEHPMSYGASTSNLAVLYE